MIQSGGRVMPSLLAGLLGGAGATYGPSMLSNKDQSSHDLAMMIAGLRQASAPGITVVTGEKPGMTVTTIALVGLTTAGVGYCAMKLSGYSLSSLYWVSKKTFEAKCTELHANIKEVHKSLTGFQTFVNKHFSILTSKQDAMYKSQKEMSSQLCEVSVDVSQSKDAINGMTACMSNIELTVEEVANKQNLASSLLEESHRGVQLLCKIVSNTMDNRETSHEDARMLRDFCDDGYAQQPMMDGLLTPVHVRKSLVSAGLMSGIFASATAPLKSYSKAWSS
jgi:hypothetical protein